MKPHAIRGLAAPVILAIGSATALAQDPNPTAQPTPQQQTAPAQQGTSPAPAETQSGSDWRSSKIVGMSVFNNAGESIGEVNDLIVSSDGSIQKAVLGVGGFLGLGERLVAVQFTDLKFSRDDRGNLRATLNSSREALQSQPEFKYQDDRRS